MRPQQYTSRRKGSLGTVCRGSVGNLSAMAEQKGQIKMTADRIKAKLEDLSLNQPVDLVVWGVKGQTARCRIPKTDQEMTLRASGLWDIVPGEIITVLLSKGWTYAGHPYLSGKILRTRLDISELDLP